MVFTDDFVIEKIPPFEYTLLNYTQTRGSTCKDQVYDGKLKWKGIEWD